MTKPQSRKRSFWRDAVLLALAAAAFVGMIQLGNWQMTRLSWKLDLIEQVERNAFGAPVSVSVEDDPQEYLRVVIKGTYRHDATVLVKAVTELGPGRWVVTPLNGAAGSFWVNRGFIPTGMAVDAVTKPKGVQSVTGLVRESAEGGTLLERNDPGAARWVSIDVGVLSETFALRNAAPFYVAAEHAGAAEAWPRGGLTKLKFRNTHLSYALTWYAMAALFFLAMCYVIWDRIGSKPRVA